MIESVRRLFLIEQLWDFRRPAVGWDLGLAIQMGQHERNHYDQSCLHWEF